MSDFDLSMKITGDGSGAASAANTVASALDSVEAAQARAAAGSNQFAAATDKLAGELDDAKRQAADAAGKIDIITTRMQAAARGADDLTKASTRQTYAIRNLGQQFGDFGLQVASGQDPARAFAQQVGQMGYALSEFEKGPLKGVGAFLTGPWGIALTIGAAVAAPFIERILDSNAALAEQKKNLEEAAKAADSFGNAQKLIAGIIDTNTGALKTHNLTLIETIRLQASAGLAQAKLAEKDASTALGRLGSTTDLPGIGPTAGVAAAFAGGTLNFLFGQGTAGTQVAPDLSNLAEQFKAGMVSITQARQEIEKLGAAGKLAGQDVNDVVLAFTKLGTSKNDQKAYQEVLDAIDGKGISPDLVPYSRAKTKRTRTPKLRDPSSEIDGLVNEANADISQYGSAPTYLAKANLELAKLQQGLEKLDKIKPRSPLDVDKIAAAKVLLDQAAEVIRDNLDKPFRDFLRSQDEAYQKAKLIAAGQFDQANAFGSIIALQKQMGPLDDAHLDAIVQSVTKLREQADAYELIRQRQNILLQGLETYRQDFEGLFTGAEKLKDLPKKLVVDFKTLSGKLLFNDLFGKAFQDLERQITGSSGIGGATDELKAAIAAVTPATKDFQTDLGTAGKAANDLADAFHQAATKIATGGTAAAITPPTPSVSIAGTPGTSVFDEATNEIVVTPNKPATTTGAGAITTSLGLTQSVFMKLAKGLNISDESAKYLATKSASAIKGAAEGALTNSVFAPIAKGLGIKTSSTGASIGGAIGNLIPGVGGIIGGIAGSIIGGLFKKTRYATAVVTNGDVSQGSSNSASRAQVASADASSVSSGVQSIVDALGGTLGNYAVSIGKYKDSFRVSGTGYSGKLGGSDSRNAREQITAYDTEEEAVNAAIANAIQDGAIQGISAAMQRAVQANSTNADKAVSEALKVKSIETAIASVGNSFLSVFQNFDAQAKDALTTAQKYGINISQVEQYYATQRAKLVSDTLKQSVGSLQDFLDSVTYGDLADGSAADKRNALLTKIATTKAAASGGDQDAINSLADLYQQLVSNTKDAFGTAGSEYASDKGTAVSGAQSVIQQETDRINQAAASSAATTNAVNQNNALTSETNDLLAQQNAILLSMISVTSGGSGVSAFSSPSRNLVKKI